MYICVNKCLIIQHNVATLISRVGLNFLRKIDGGTGDKREEYRGSLTYCHNIWFLPTGRYSGPWSGRVDARAPRKRCV